MTNFSSDGLGRGGWMKVALGAAVLLGVLGTRRAEAAITLQETVEPIDARLEAAGWMGIKLTLVADAKSGTVGGIDFKNYVSLQTDILLYGSTFKYVSDIPLNEAVGISGPVHQAWFEQEGDTYDTSTGKMPKLGSATDSSFLNSSLFQTGDGFAEDNNLMAGGDGTDFGVSPLNDYVGTNGDEVLYGVGSQMTFSAGIPWQKQVASLDFAFLIVPAGGNDVYLRGFLIDGYGASNVIDQVINPMGLGAGGMIAADASAVPEAGTVGVLGFGAVVLGRRRRRGGSR